MPDYKSMYFRLFNRISDVITCLQEAQLESESTYIECDKEKVVTVTHKEGIDKLEK